MSPPACALFACSAKASPSGRGERIVSRRTLAVHGSIPKRGHTETGVAVNIQLETTTPTLVSALDYTVRIMMPVPRTARVYTTILCIYAEPHSSCHSASVVPAFRVQ